MSGSQLPAEIWARIFLAVQQDIYMDRRLDPLWCVSQEIAVNQTRFHGPLKLVCRQFLNVFAEHPDLYSLYVHAAPQTKYVASWLNWMQQHGHALKDITVAGNSIGVPEALLPVLHLQQTHYNQRGSQIQQTMLCMCLHVLQP